MVTENSALEHEAAQALASYGLTAAELLPLKGGLINHSFRVETGAGQRYVLQRLHPVFPPEVNLNLAAVSRQLTNSHMVTPLLLPAADGRQWVTLANRHWRLLSYIDGTSVDTLTNPAMAHEAGLLLARFHCALSEAPVALPYLRTPVHEPVRHFAALQAALHAHATHPLLHEVSALAREIEQTAQGLPALATVPLRLVHGDPKISNLLFDHEGHGLCLVDLDTLGRAPLAYELGDAFRSWCNPGPEDGSQAGFSLDLFDAALAGYASVGRTFMTSAEQAAIVPATLTIYLELAARFAADALHEQYFGWSPERYRTRGEHNLARTRNQLAAAACLRARQAEAEAIRRRVFA